MPWPQYVYRAFNLVSSDTTLENEWNAAWTAVLVTVFPLSEGFLIHPQCCLSHDQRAVDYSVKFVVTHHDKETALTVFLLELKAGPRLRHRHERKKADEQLRDRFEELLDDPCSKTVHAVSAFGEKFAVYQFNVEKDEITPKKPSRHPPIERWRYGILDPAGIAQFVEIRSSVDEMLGLKGKNKPSGSRSRG